MDWFRWHHGSVSDPKLALVAKECSMPVACVVGLWAYILEAASANDLRGQVDNFDEEVASFHLGLDVVTPCNAMKRRGMLHETDGVLFVSNWAKRQVKREREDDSTGRVQKHRHLKKQQLTEVEVDETPCNATQRHETPREDKSREDIDTYVNKLPVCPTDEVISLYHEHLPQLPTVRVMNIKRQKAIGTFWKWVLTSKRGDGSPRAQDAEQALNWIGEYFRRASGNDFLMGRSGGTWTADLDFLLSEKGKIQVIEKTKVAA
jgi:hypothetical protein